MSQVTPQQKIIELIAKYDKFLLVLHHFPDGDTIASSLALYWALKELGKEVVCVCQDEIPTPFLFLPGVLTIKRDFLWGDFEVIVILDCGDLKMTGFAERIAGLARLHNRQRIIVNIDHHPTNDIHKIAQVNFFNPQASAVGEIIFELLKILKVAIDKKIATCLLTALYTDTGGFQHTNVTPRTLKIASELMIHGGRLKLIAKNITNTKSVASLKLWGVALSRMRFEPKLGLAVSCLTQEDLRSCKADDADTAGVINLINSIPQASASLLIFETKEGKIKASLRSAKDGVDVSRLAQIFGGGGHKKAAGFLLDGKIAISEGGKWKVNIS